MALVSCARCGNSISDKAYKCPKCEYVTKSNERVVPSKTLAVDSYKGINSSAGYAYINVAVISAYIFLMSQLLKHNGDRYLLSQLSDGKYAYIVMLPLIIFLVAILGNLLKFPASQAINIIFWVFSVLIYLCLFSIIR
jgi:hypothetical protein